MTTTLAIAATLLVLTFDAVVQPAQRVRDEGRALAPRVARLSGRVELPKVRLIATGGTIASRAGGRLTADELLASVPSLETFVRPEAEQFANLSSGELTLAQWLDLSRRANALLETDVAGIVVTTGTDTLEETAYFLHLTVRSRRPVVVVGAMRPPGAPGYDGVANLLAAFRVAAEPQSQGRGVLVVLNDEIHSSRDVSKTDTFRLHAFRSRGAGRLGVVDQDRVIYERDFPRRHTWRTEFDVSTVHTLPRVDVLMVYQDAPGDLIKAAVDLGAKGLVLATAGAGSLSGTQAEAVEDALERGVTVVRSTRTGGGRLPPASRGGHRVTVAADDLSSIKARVLLMLALSITTDHAEIQRMFTEY